MNRSASLILIQAGFSTAISSDDEVVTVASGPAIIFVQNSQISGSVELDGIEVTGARQGNGIVFSADFTRSVGFHYIRLGANLFSFATEDAKLQLAGVIDMLRSLKSEGLSFGKQLVFADGSSIDALSADFTWIWRWLPQIADAIEQVARDPLSVFERRNKISTSSVKGLNVPATIRMLRSRRDFVIGCEKSSESGFSSKRRRIRAVVVRHFSSNVDSIENRRTIALAELCVGLCRTLASIIDKHSSELLMRSVGRIKVALKSPSLRSVRALTDREISRTRSETHDPRYSFIYDRFVEARKSKWGVASSRAATLSSFVKHSDEIYQAFVVIQLARAFDAKPVYDELSARRRGPSFESESFRIFYDTEPESVATTWRSETSRPDFARPDIVIQHVSERSFLILDAKYRNAGNKASTDSLREVQYYLDTYGVRNATVCYPPQEPTYLEIGILSGRGKTLCELPISPSANLELFLTETAKPQLLALFDTQRSDGT